MSRRAGRSADDLVEQVANTVAVFGGDLDDRLEAELIELDRAAARPLVVGLVDRHQHRHVHRAEPLGDLLVAGHQPVASIYNEDNDLRRFERPLARRCTTSSWSGSCARAEHPAGIDQRERNPLPLSRLRDHVARRPGDRR